MLQTLHCRWGHVGVNRMHRILDESGGITGEIKSICDSAVRGCPICEAHKLPKPVAHSAHREPVALGHTVSGDIAFRDDFAFLVLVDHATLYTVAGVITSKRPDVVWERFKEMRLTPFGAPHIFVSDSGGEIHFGGL